MLDANVAATLAGEDLGPFTSENEARLAVGDYLTELLEGEDRLAGATAAERAERAEMRLQEVRDFLHRRESEGSAAARLWAEQRLDSGLAALIVGSMPLWVALMESLIDHRRPSLLLSASLVVGFAAPVAATAIAFGDYLRPALPWMPTPVAANIRPGTT